MHFVTMAVSFSETCLASFLQHCAPTAHTKIKTILGNWDLRPTWLCAGRPLFWNLKPLSLVDDYQHLQLEGGPYIHTD